MKNSFYTNKVRTFLLVICITIILIALVSIPVLTAHASYSGSSSGMTREQIHTATLSTSVKSDTPAITVFMHGLGGSAKDWSNNFNGTKGSRTAFVKDSDSLMEKMRESSTGLKLYRAKTYSNNSFSLYSEYSETEVTKINDFSNHTKIGAGSSNTSLRAVPEKEVFSFAETREFISKLNELAPEDIYKKIPIKLMLLMGMRTAEVCGLRWSDIDFKKKTIRVNRNRLYTKEFGIYEKEPKTATSLRDIPMPDALINDLIIYMEWFRQADALFDERLDEYYLAVNVYRLPIFPQSIGQYLKRYERQWGMKEVTCHGLRHTYCSLLLSQNVPIQTVSKYMGHSDSTVTLKVYSHFIPDTQDTALTALNNIME